MRCHDAVDAAASRGYAGNGLYGGHKKVPG